MPPPITTAATPISTRPIYDRAIADFTQAIKLDDKDAFAYHDRAVAYYEKHDVGQAIADFEAVAKLVPNFVVAPTPQGSGVRNQRGYDRDGQPPAKIKVSPVFALAYNQRGTELAAKGDVDRALADFERAIKIYPNFYAAYYNRGNALAGKRDYSAAIASYDQAIRYNPKDTMAYYDRGVARLRKRGL